MYNASDSSHLHEPNVVNCTFSENICTGSKGGAIRNYGASLTMVNSILWGNIADDGPEMAMAQSYIVVNVSYCDIQDGWAGVHTENSPTINWGPGNITSDPNFIDADGADDVIGTVDDDLRPSAGALCLDAGDNDAVPADVLDLDDDDDTVEQTPIDRNGDLRFVDDPEADDLGNGAAPIVDMGAYEREVCGDAAHPHPIADLNKDCRVGPPDFAIMAAHWLEGGCAGPLTCGGADLDGSGTVNLVDFAILAAHWMECTAPECD